MPIFPNRFFTLILCIIHLMKLELYINKTAKYIPSDENPSESPKLPYVDALFKRRLSQISRMTIEVVHNVVDGSDLAKDTKLVFASFRGEIARQLKVNKGLVEDFEVLPAQFSISVFNTPPAVATIALGMKAGYTAVYPGRKNFSAALASAVAPILSGKEKHVIFAFADEKVPDEYEGVDSGAVKERALAFACEISSEKADGGIPLAKLEYESPWKFLESIEK